jgi:hypothetical protein
MRSCSSPVLVQETAEKVVSMHSALLMLVDHGQPGRRLWRQPPQRPVRTVSVVMLDVDADGLLEVAAADDQQQVPGLLGDPATVGLTVTPTRWTRRVASSTKNSTYRRRSQMVST